MDPKAKPSASSQKPPPPTVLSPPPPLHQIDADEDDDTVKQLNECSTVYLSLQDCLVSTNRNWKSCQKEVLALKACNEKRNSDKRK